MTILNLLNLGDIYHKLEQIRQEADRTGIGRLLEQILKKMDRLDKIENRIEQIEREIQTLDARTASMFDLQVHQLPLIAASLASIDAKTPVPAGLILADEVDVSAVPGA